MTSLRISVLAIGAMFVLTTTGCRTAGVGRLSRDEPLSPRSSLTASELMSDHNRNAELVKSLEAQPTVSGSNRSRLIPPASANLAFERSRNFRLEVKTPMGTEVADIGSNDDEFWFWFKDDPKRSVYFCNYDENGSSPVALGLQPEWIVDALGLRPYSEAELSRMQVSPGRDPGTVVLTERVEGKKGGYSKEIVLSELTRQIKEQRILAKDGRTLLARTVVFDYETHPLAPASTGESAGKVFLPKKLRLELTQEKMGLDVSMRQVKLNKLEASRREYLFVEPKYDEFARVNLADQADVAVETTPPKRGGRTTVRETMPAPPPRVRLVEPAPLGLRSTRSSDREPAMIGRDMPPSNARGIEEVVGPPIPTVAEPAPGFVQANSGWRSSLER